MYYIHSHTKKCLLGDYPNAIVWYLSTSHSPYTHTNELARATLLLLYLCTTFTPTHIITVLPFVRYILNVKLHFLTAVVLSAITTVLSLSLPFWNGFVCRHCSIKIEIRNTTKVEAIQNIFIIITIFRRWLKETVQ